MKTIIILSLLLASIQTHAGFRFMSSGSNTPSKAELECIEAYQMLKEKNEAADCGHMTEARLKEAFYQKKVLRVKECRGLRHPNGDYKATLVWAQLEYNEHACLKQFLSANPKVEKAWSDEMILPASRKDNDWWKTILLFVLAIAFAIIHKKMKKKE